MVSHRLLLVSVGLAGLCMAGPVQAAPAPPPPPSAQQYDAPAANPSPPPAGQSQGAPPPADTSRSGAAPPPPGTTPADERPRASAEPGDAPADLSGTWSYSRRRASPEPRYREAAAQPSAPNPKGFYSGVSIGGNQVPPSAPDKLGTKPVLLTWTGFERVEEGTQIYFQLSGPVNFVVTETPGRIVIKLPNTRPNVRNNLRGLDLRFFDTPAKGVTLKKRGRDIVVTIDLKKRTRAVIEQVEGQTGYKMLVVRFAEAKPERMDEPPVRR
jgi:hypothetical protein